MLWDAWSFHNSQKIYISINLVINPEKSTEKYQNIFPSLVLRLTLKQTINKQTDVNLLVETGLKRRSPKVTGVYCLWTVNVYVGQFIPICQFTSMLRRFTGQREIFHHSSKNDCLKWSGNPCSTASWTARSSLTCHLVSVHFFNTCLHLERGRLCVCFYILSSQRSLNISKSAIFLLAHFTRRSDADLVAK